MQWIRCPRGCCLGQVLGQVHGSMLSHSKHDSIMMLVVNAFPLATFLQPTSECFAALTKFFLH